MHLFRIIRFFRLFRSLLAQHGIIRLSVAKGEGQPTRCGHTLTRCPLPGLAGGRAPLDPLTKSGLLSAYSVRRRGAFRSCAKEAHSLMPHLPSLSANKNPLLESQRQKP